MNLASTEQILPYPSAVMWLVMLAAAIMLMVATALIKRYPRR